MVGTCARFAQIRRLPIAVSPEPVPEPGPLSKAQPICPKYEQVVNKA
jgi:hypothetical protein